MGRTGLVTAALLTLAVGAAACGDDADLDAGGGPADSTTTTSEVPGPVPDPAPGDPWAELTFDIQLLGPDGAISTYELTCSDDASTVSGESEASAEAMCDALTDAAIVGRLVNPPRDRACTQIYGGPELARVTGTLDGATVDTEFRRNDGCGIADWDLLSPLLPSPL